MRLHRNAGIRDGANLCGNRGAALQLDGVAARIGFSLLLGVTAGMGLEGFWLGSALAGYVSVLLAGIYFFSGKWKTRKLTVETA